MGHSSVHHSKGDGSSLHHGEEGKRRMAKLVGIFLALDVLPLFPAVCGGSQACRARLMSTDPARGVLG